jgi:hypothetical protein
MAFGFVILAVVLLLLVAFAGLGIYAIPVGIVGVIALVVLFGSRAKKAGGSPGSGDGPGQDSHARGERPTHKREEYAHTGQAYMTPEQMRRAR